MKWIRFLFIFKKNIRILSSHFTIAIMSASAFETFSMWQAYHANFLDIACAGPRLSIFFFLDPRHVAFTLFGPRTRPRPLMRYAPGDAVCQSLKMELQSSCATTTTTTTAAATSSAAPTAPFGCNSFCIPLGKMFTTYGGCATPPPPPFMAT